MKAYFGKSARTVILGLTVAALTACLLTSCSTPSSDSVAPVPLGQAVTINISAHNLTFDKSNITVPAGADVTIIFDNKEDVSHNIAVYTTPAATELIFRGDFITGPKTITYNFKAPTIPGDYFFRCDIHSATMKGTFTVTSRWSG